MRIALVGTRGVPARYGGFETAVEEIGARLAARGHDVRVYCRGGDRQLRHYRGMRLVHLPAVRHKAAETLSHTAVSSLHLVMRRVDVCVLFNAANAPLLPLLKTARIPTAVHVDGLEWQRSKWGRFGRAHYLRSERHASRRADVIVADSHGIAEYYTEQYGVHPVYIAYGAPVLTEPGRDRVERAGLSPGSYHLAVARLEPENNVHVVIGGFRRTDSTRQLVVVGDAPYGKEYIDGLRRLAAGDERIVFLGSVWDQELLDQLYANTVQYFHGHSVGGTNPSLLRAMGAGAPVSAYDVVFNREVAGDAATYWSTPEDVSSCVSEVERDPARARERGARGRTAVAERYDWDAVASEYEALLSRLANERT